LPVWFRSLACGNPYRELLPPIVSTFTAKSLEDYAA